jgi:hypothetical protein
VGWSGFVIAVVVIPFECYVHELSKKAAVDSKKLSNLVTTQTTDRVRIEGTLGKLEKRLNDLFDRLTRTVAPAPPPPSDEPKERKPPKTLEVKCAGQEGQIGQDERESELKSPQAAVTIDP